MTKTVGIALGGGGAKGLAHLPILEALDELGVVPAQIAGTSIGAIVGALYASGMPAREARARIQELILADAGSFASVVGAGALKWLGLLGIEWERGGVLDTDGFLEALSEMIGVTRFEDLPRRLSVVATAFWRREAIVIESGELLPAVRASMALPGLFQPVRRDGMVLVDGGVANPLPFDVLDASCDVTIAVSVIGERRAAPSGALPNVVEALVQTYAIMEASLVAEKRRRREPTIFVAPEIVDVRLLEFHRAAEVMAQGDRAKEAFKRRLDAVLR